MKSMRAFFTTKTYSNVGDVLHLDALKLKLAENVVSASSIPAFSRTLRLEKSCYDRRRKGDDTRKTMKAVKTTTKKKKNKEEKALRFHLTQTSSKKTTTSVRTALTT